MTQPDDSRDAELDRDLHALPAGIEPSRDLWPGIEAQLEPRESATRRNWVWQAAAAAVLVVASSLLTAQWMRRETPVVAQAPPAETVTTPPAARRAAFGPSHSLNAEYVAARGQLAKMLDARIDRLPASTRTKVEQNLAEMRRAANDINSALATQPGDPLLEELLLTTYQEELAVLASVNQLAAAGENSGVADDEGISL